MQFTITTNEFLKALNTVNHAIASKALNPAQLCFKIDMDDRGLTLTGSNSEIAIKTTIPTILNDKEIIRDFSEGSTCLNAKILTELIRRIDAKEVKLEIFDNIAMIDDGKSSFKLICMDSEEYPDLDFSLSQNKFTVSKQNLTQIVDQTAFAALNKEGKPIFKAINLKTDGNKLVAVATDSARLSRKVVEIDGAYDINCNIPAKTLQDVTKMLDGVSDVTLCLGQDKVLFIFNNTIVSSRLIAGNYPAVGAVIPTNFSIDLEVDAREFLAAMDRVSIVNQDGTSCVTLSLDETSAIVSSNSSNNGQAKEMLKSYRYSSGEKFDISFNPLFVSGAIKALGSVDVTFRFSGTMKPFVVINPTDDSVIELITPLRTR